LVLVEEAGAKAELEKYYLFHAARADLLRRLNRLQEAQAAYLSALALTTNHVAAYQSFCSQFAGSA
jgi:RNA polymerase sigma-70 factor (ECF subfamily)